MKTFTDKTDKKEQKNMLFTVTEIQTEKNIIYVSGNTLSGKLKGIWKNNNIPFIDRTYNIELAFSTTDRKSVTMSRPPSNIETTNDRVVFTGICEDIDEIYYIRFSDGLEMLDITDDDFTIRKGDYISFSKHFNETEIYPY